MASTGIAMTKTTMQGIGLKHVAAVLSDLIQEAQTHNYTYREFLDRVMDHELEKRNEKRKRRNLSGAHFPPNPKPIDEFDTAELDSGITP